MLVTIQVIVNVPDISLADELASGFAEDCGCECAVASWPTLAEELAGYNPDYLRAVSIPTELPR